MFKTLSLLALMIFSNLSHARFKYEGTQGVKNSPIGCEGRAGCFYINETDSARTGLKVGCWCDSPKVRGEDSDADSKVSAFIHIERILDVKVQDELQEEKYQEESYEKQEISE